MNSNEHTHTQKKQLYRWIGLAIGLFLGILLGFICYQWFKKEAAIHFQENIGEVKCQTELQQWQMKNPKQAMLMATELQKSLGIYEEMRGETNPERIQQRAMQRLQEMNEEEQEKYSKKVMKIYQQYAPSFLESLEKEFPWHLRYYWLVIIFLVLVSIGISFLVGYLLEPMEETKY